MGEKTEKATPKKLRDARKKGQVAKSQDLPSAFTFIASLSITMALSAFLFGKLSLFIKGTFSMVQSPDLTKQLPALMYEAIKTILLTSLPILALVAMLGVLVNFLAVGPIFSTEVFKPDIKKFDPIANIKSKFKMKTLIELLKSTLKITIAGIIIYLVMYNSIPLLIRTVSLPIFSSLLIFHSLLIELVVKVGLFFIVVAILDFAYQKYNFAKEMKMEKFEIKQEYKNSEGDPQIKGKRKEIAREIAYSEGPASGLQKSKALITNPTEIAVALAYERDRDAAPYIVAMGEGIIAQRMVTIAKQMGLPILRNISLAHKLYEEGELYEYVPEDTYEAIAEILRWLANLEEGIIEEYRGEEREIY